MRERGKSGIYAIVNMASQKSYVGQAVSIGDRWLYHLSSLRRGKHHSRYLQNAWNKYGEAAFLFKVIEFVPVDKLLLADREQMWIDIIDPEYNVARAAASTLGVKHPPRSDEFKRRMSEKQKGFRHSPETIDKLKEIAAARAWRPSPEHREKLRAANIGRKDTPQRLEKFRAKVIGRKHSPEHIAKRVAKLIGHPTSEATKRAIGEANSKRLLGTKQSPELIEKRIAPLRGRSRPEVGDKLRGKKRPAHVVAAVQEANRVRWAARVEEIKAAIRANPNSSATSIARSIGADRNTVSKYRKELQCQPVQPSASAPAARALLWVQGDLFK